MSYVSYACSRWYKLFQEMGYPRLDIVEFGDGEWAIREFESIPVVPSLTKWKYVLQGLQNIEISLPFIKKYVNQIDTMRKEKWETEEARSRAIIDEQQKAEKHKEFLAEEGAKLVMKNEAIKERIAKNGLSELSPTKMLKNLEPWQQRQFGFERTK